MRIVIERLKIYTWGTTTTTTRYDNVKVKLSCERESAQCDACSTNNGNKIPTVACHLLIKFHENYCIHARFKPCLCQRRILEADLSACGLLKHLQMKQTTTTQ